MRNVHVRVHICGGVQPNCENMLITKRATKLNVPFIISLVGDHIFQCAELVVWIVWIGGAVEDAIKSIGHHLLLQAPVADQTKPVIILGHRLEFSSLFHLTESLYVRVYVCVMCVCVHVRDGRACVTWRVCEREERVGKKGGVAPPAEGRNF
jgi:hypothetical protein